MDLIKLLNVANPKTIKDTINALITSYEDFGERMEGLATEAAEAAKSALDTMEGYDQIVNESKQSSDAAKQTAEEALAMIEQADKRSQEAALLAEQSWEVADEAKETSELAMNVATEARSTIDQAIDTGVLGTFVHNPYGVSLLHARMTDNLEQEDDEEHSYIATPKLVKDALQNYASKNVTILPENTDLDTLTEPGVYFAIYPPLNSPVSGSVPFLIFVYDKPFEVPPELLGDYPAGIFRQQIILMDSYTAMRAYLTAIDANGNVNEYTDRWSDWASVDLRQVVTVGSTNSPMQYITGPKSFVDFTYSGIKTSTSTTAVLGNIWFNGNKHGQPMYNNNFRFSPSTETMHVTNIEVNTINLV